VLILHFNNLVYVNLLPPSCCIWLPGASRLKTQILTAIWRHFMYTSSLQKYLLHCMACALVQVRCWCLFVPIHSKVSSPVRVWGLPAISCFPVIEMAIHRIHCLVLASWLVRLFLDPSRRFPLPTVQSDKCTHFPIQREYARLYAIHVTDLCVSRCLATALLCIVFS
jgi:hypothetical protein